MPEINEDPIATRANGAPIFDNAATVVCILMSDGKDNIILIRRNNQPGKGFVALPGGYQMRGETWQEAGARELFEETGWVIDPEFIMPIEIVTDEYQNNVIFAYYGEYAENADDPAFDVSFVTPEEIQEVLYLSKEQADKEDWAFPLHYRVYSDAVWPEQDDTMAA